jgi:hypothetical protein
MTHTGTHTQSKQSSITIHTMINVNESDGNDDVDRMDDIVADIGRGYDLESEDPPLEVQNFYRLLATSEEKVHDGSDMTVLQAVTRLMGFKSK